MYNLPLTLKTYIPSGWKNVSVGQGKQKTTATPKTDEKGSYVLYQARPNEGAVTLSEI
jgi:hypothetical protein